jgi:hypothetical protein
MKLTRVLLAITLFAGSAFGSGRHPSPHSYYARSSTSYSHRSSSSSTRHSARSRSSASSSHRYSGSGSRSSRRASAARDSHGKIKRSRAERSVFMRSHPCPSTGKRSGACAGYIVDHVKPLDCGGADVSSNMQWQRTAEGKAKDKWEGRCR